MQNKIEIIPQIPFISFKCIYSFFKKLYKVSIIENNFFNSAILNGVKSGFSNLLLSKVYSFKKLYNF